MKSVAAIIIPALMLPMLWSSCKGRSDGALILPRLYEYGSAGLSMENIQYVTNPEPGMKENVRHFYLMGTSCDIQLYSRNLLE